MLSLWTTLSLVYTIGAGAHFAIVVFSLSYVHSHVPHWNPRWLLLFVTVLAILWPLIYILAPLFILLAPWLERLERK